MAKSGKPKPWASRWELIAALGQGGQGQTSQVRDKETGECGVLKVQRHGAAEVDPERRGRFRREAVALQTLQHTRAPRLLDHNTDQYQDLGVPLFMVQEFIPGPTLEEHVKDHGPLPVDHALALTSALLDVLGHCHGLGMGHRDVKPDNIVLRGGDPTDPVLVDFGQSFSTVVHDSMATEAEQIMGNRFLALPELVSGSNKRDFRSDLTLLAGVLFYSLTTLVPRQLQDGERERPHRRADASARLAKVAKGDLLGWFFDQAFRVRPAMRFQDAETFGKALDYTASGEEPPLEGILAAANEHFAKSLEVQVSKTLEPFTTNLREIARRASKEVHAELTEVPAHTIKPKNHALSDGTREIVVGVGVNVGAGHRANAAIWLRRAGERYEVRAGIPGRDERCVEFETGVKEPTVPPDFRARFATVLAKELARVVREEVQGSEDL